ncbi:hypothetical protein HDV06_002154 [Boothiomyces sp. JEL0866]|nr:hypothetical protein HDV06_002154 [Boothiomyces sp. JEL0866]
MELPKSNIVNQEYCFKCVPGYSATVVLVLDPFNSSEDDYEYGSDFDDEELDEQLKLYQQQILLIYQTNQQLKEAIGAAEEAALINRQREQELQSLLGTLKSNTQQ